MGPEEIIDQVIPLLNGGFIEESGVNSKPPENTAPNTELDKKFPVKIIAQEAITQSLNTETKAILGDYTFEQLGAFSVYSTVHPLAHISVSGDGIVAIDANGDTTFTLDGETGDATFLGTVRAGSLISGDIVLGGNGGEDGSLTVNDSSNNPFAILDDEGLKLYQQTSLKFISGTDTIGYFGPFGGAVWLSTALGVAFNMQAIGGSDWYFGTGPGYAGNLVIHGNFSVTGAKSARVKIDGEDVLFYALESPRDTWFFDFADDLEHIDSIFLAATEGGTKSITTNEGDLLVFRKRKQLDN